ncbi:MAG: glycine zipper 2TM domain-containing protein [Burkholderiales bacterium]
MNTSTLKKSGLLAVLSVIGAAAGAQEVGRVISTTPVIQQFAVPRQVCSNTQQTVQSQKSGGGAVLGAIAGGAVGNQIGNGGGRALATAIGLFGGAVLGNNIEGSGTEVQNVTQCTTQTFYENRPVAYNVVYEYAGKQYQVQLPQDPGPSIQLQVTPVSTGNQTPINQRPIGQPLTQVYEGESTVVTQAVAAPVVVRSYPYYVTPRPYYAPLGVSLNLGYSRGYYGHGHGYRRY